MKLTGRGLLRIFKTAAKDWLADKAPRLGASLSFYTLFSLSPLLVLLVAIAGLWAQDNATGEVFSQIGSIIGKENADSLRAAIERPGKESQGIMATVAASVMLVFGATGVFTQLQDALNEIWEVEQKPGQGVMGFIRHRLLSFAMILGIAFLLLTSLVLSAGMNAAGKYAGHWLGGMEWLVQALHIVGSFGIVTILFAAMFKYVPDAKIAWRDVWFGAVFTAILFTAGKFLLARYIGKNSLVSTYAAAASLIVVLLWVYYSAQILFFGAELTQAYAYEMGREVQPSKHAQWDQEKLCASKAAEVKQEQREAIKEGKPAFDPAPAMALAMGGVGIERGSARRNRNLNGKSLLWMGLAAVALWPVRRHLRRVAKATHLH